MLSRLSILLFTGFLILANISCNSEKESKVLPENMISEEFSRKTDSTFNLMNSNKFELAESIILNLHNESRTPMEHYLVNCYQAELFYYNDLPELGIRTTNEALTIANYFKKPELIANCYNFLGLFNLNSSHFKEALSYFNEAKSKLPENISDPNLVRYDQLLNNIAENYLKLKLYDSAIWYAKRSLDIFPGIKKTRTVALSYWELGEGYLGLNQTEAAEEYFKKSLHIGEEYSEYDILHYTYSGLIKCYMKLSKFNEAKKLVEAGIKEEILMNSNKLATKEFFETSLNALRQLNESEKLIDLLNTYVHVQKTERESEKKNQYLILKTYFENKKNLIESNAQNQINEQKITYNNRLIFFISATFLILLLAVYLFFQNKQNKVRIKNVEMENELLSLKKDSEMNALIAKTEAILEERNRLARELHDDIGSSMSSVNIYAEVALREMKNNPEKSKFAIEKQKKQISTINENISDLIWAIYSKNESFTNLFERIRDFAFDILNSSNIHFEFLFDERLNNLILKPDAKKNLLLIVKEFINNSLKYSSAGKIQIKFSMLSADEFQLTIEDNGTGFNINSVRKGNGIDSFYKRAESMNAVIEYNSIVGNGTYLKINTRLIELVDDQGSVIS